MTTSSDKEQFRRRASSPSLSPRRLLSASPEETERIGADVGRILEKGPACVLLSGDLGTGKTTFIRGLAKGLKVFDPGSVRSPSYTLVNRYPGKVSLTHIDAYFMRSAEDLDLCGYDDALARGDVVAVEWADRVRGIFFPEGWDSIPGEAGGEKAAVAAFVSMEHRGEGTRWIEIAFFSSPPFFLKKTNGA